VTGEQTMNGHGAADVPLAAGASQGQCGAEVPEAYVARLTGYCRSRRALFAWMHPRRRPAVLEANHLDHCSEAQAADLADAYLDTLGMPMPALDAFGAPGAALAVLPVSECLNVFRLRALAEHAESLRTWIDRPRRSLLMEWVGARGVRLLFDRSYGLVGEAWRFSLRAQRGTSVPAEWLQTADGDALAWVGFRLFERECRWMPEGPLALTQLALPEQLAVAVSLPEEESGETSNASFTIVSQLPALFPEWSW
jgi:hypothetical protein